MYTVRCTNCVHKTNDRVVIYESHSVNEFYLFIPLFANSGRRCVNYDEKKL